MDHNWVICMQEIYILNVNVINSGNDHFQYRYYSLNFPRHFSNWLRASLETIQHMTPWHENDFDIIGPMWRNSWFLIFKHSVDYSYKIENICNEEI